METNSICNVTNLAVLNLYYLYSVQLFEQIYCFYVTQSQSCCWSYEQCDSSGLGK